MAYVNVVEGDKGTWKVLVNFIQRGISYTSKAVAEKEADKVRKYIQENGGEVK